MKIDVDGGLAVIFALEVIKIACVQSNDGNDENNDGGQE